MSSETWLWRSKLSGYEKKKLDECLILSLLTLVTYYQLDCQAGVDLNTQEIA